MSRKVTFTGVDERTDIDKLINLHNKYNFIEFGILMSKNNTDTGANNRYPSFEFIDRLLDKGLTLSCHICGGLARQFMKTGNFSEIEEFLSQERIKYFNRFQFNIKGFEDYNVFDIPSDINIIIQSSNWRSYRYYLEMNKRPKNEGRVSALIDNSGGKGILGNFSTVADTDNYIGYAGGISLDNIAYILGYIDGRNKYNKDYWIDMESSVRTSDDWFDVYKVEEICDEVVKCENTRLCIK